MDMKSKFFNYLLFIAVGLVCAELLSLSNITTLISPLNYWGYGLVYLLLVHIIVKYDLRDFRSYYLLGVFVSILTETFITKVLWNVPWRQAGEALGFKLFGFGVVDSLMLTFFWHPVLSFAVPVLICNYFFGFPNPRGLVSEKRMRLILGILPVVLALSSAINPLLLLILGAAGINIAMLALYIFMFRKFKSDKFLLSRRGIIVDSLVIVATFTWAYLTIVDYFPSVPTLVLTFAIIGLFTLLNYLNIKRMKKTVSKGASAFSWKGYLLYCLYFLGTFIVLGAAFLVIPAIGPILYLTAWFGSAIAGTVYFLRISLEILTGK